MFRDSVPHLLFEEYITFRELVPHCPLYEVHSTCHEAVLLRLLYELHLRYVTFRLDPFSPRHHGFSAIECRM
jgi:hypothetical protein